MKEIMTTIILNNGGEQKEYKEQKVLYYTRGKVNFYQFTIHAATFTIAVLQDKVYIYSKNTFRYRLKLEKNKEIQNSIQTAYGHFFTDVKLTKLEYQQMSKCNLTLEYILNFSGYRQYLFLHLKEE